MSVYYDGSHSVTFYYTDNGSYYKKNTWDDFHLVPASRPYVVAPSPNIQLVTLPRSNNVLDVTNALSRDIVYNAREGDWEFYIDHDKWNSWMEAFDTIGDVLNGRAFKIVLEDQPDIRYTGRINLSSYNPGGDYSRVSIHYNIDVIEEEVEDPDDPGGGGSGGDDDPSGEVTVMLKSGTIYESGEYVDIVKNGSPGYRCIKGSSILDNSVTYPYQLKAVLYVTDHYLNMRLYMAQHYTRTSTGREMLYGQEFAKNGSPTLMEDGRYKIEMTLTRTNSEPFGRDSLERRVWIGQKWYDNYQAGGEGQRYSDNTVTIRDDGSEYELYCTYYKG